MAKYRFYRKNTTTCLFSIRSPRAPAVDFREILRFHPGRIKYLFNVTYCVVLLRERKQEIAIRYTNGLPITLRSKALRNLLSKIRRSLVIESIDVVVGVQIREIRGYGIPELLSDSLEPSKNPPEILLQTITALSNAAYNCTKVRAFLKGEGFLHQLNNLKTFCQTNGDGRVRSLLSSVELLITALAQ
ncbi:hypothetical protein ACTXT7_009315 [Hymenolepis weldensis]